MQKPDSSVLRQYELTGENGKKFLWKGAIIKNFAENNVPLDPAHGVPNTGSTPFKSKDIYSVGTSISRLEYNVKYKLNNGNYVVLSTPDQYDESTVYFYSASGLLYFRFGVVYAHPPTCNTFACFVDNGVEYFSYIIVNPAFQTPEEGHTLVSFYLRDFPEMTDFFKGSEPLPEDPYGPESKPGGGGGTFDPSGDQIKNPGTPQAGAGGSGFVSLYQPTVAQVKSLYNFLWSDLVSVDTFKKLFNDPMEALISFAAVPALSKAGVQKNIFFGNLDTGIQSVEIGQYQHLNCGSIKLAEFFGSALDYAPYTQLTIFLPYVGYQELNVNDFMGKDIGVEYTVDMLSGACVAFVKAGTTIVSQFAGNCLSPIPITARDQNDIYKGALSAAAVVAGAVAMVATAGTAAPAVGAAVTTAGTPAAGAAAAGLGAKGVALAAGGALTAANIATTSRPHYQRSGSINGASGILGIQTPYLIIERPDQSLAHDYNKFVGYPANLTLKLGDLSGFTQVESIRLDGFAGASAAEISEIDGLLKSGVIL